MDILDKLTEKLRKHVWCIIAFAAMLLFWFIAFSVTGKADNIAVWLSIVLSIIVIGYMFFQAYEMRNLIGEGQRIIAEKAGAMTETAGVIEQRAEAFLAMMKSRSTPTGEGQESEGYPLELNLSNAGAFALIYLYLLTTAHVHKKSFHLNDVAAVIERGMEASDERLTWGVLYGTQQAFECLLKPGSIQEGRHGTMVTLPPKLEAYILKESKLAVNTRYRVDSYATQALPKIDAYFESLDQVT